MMRHAFWIAGLVLTLNLQAASDRGAPVPSATGTSTREGVTSVASEHDFLITPDDVLEIIVFDVPQMSRQYRVSPSGVIVFPLLAEPIHAAGMTPAQLSQAIATELRNSGMVSNPQVNVEVKESRLHSVAVTRNMASSRRTSCRRRSTLPTRRRWTASLRCV